MGKILGVPGTLFVLLLAGCVSGPYPLPTTNSTATTTAAHPQPLNTPTTPSTPATPSTASSGSSGYVTVGQTSGRFTVTANLATARAGHTATLLPDGRVLLAGGGQLDIDDLLVSTSSVETLSPSGQATSTGNLSTPREFHAATLLQSGKVLITGGNVFEGYPTGLPATPSAELYDAAVGQFTATGDMSAPRTGHTASLLQDGRVLIFGGTASDTPSAEFYDPDKGTFSPAPSPMSLRSGQTATVLPSGKVLFIGGQNNSGTLASAEIYDPSTNSFREVGSMAEQRVSHTATLLPNGKVLITGGGIVSNPGKVSLDYVPQLIVDSPSQTAELFDPQTETFSSAGTMSEARSNHTATLLPDGTVLLFGGSYAWSTSSGYVSDSTAEIYDPTAGSFKAAGTANTGKFWHTATLLPNGTVVLIGGIANDWALNVWLRPSNKAKGDTVSRLVCYATSTSIRAFNMSFRARLAALFTVGLMTLQPAHGQTAAGSITGRVADIGRAAIPRVSIEITNEETGLKHTYITGADGEYRAPALPAGDYQLVALSPGFERLLREVVVEAGTTTTADLTMLVGTSTSSITVNSATPQMHYDSFEISGVTTRSGIENTPLNGRNFLELAKLEPGALQPARGSNDRVFVPLLTSPAGGNNGRGTRVTVDGGSVMQIGNGGAAMGFSQEVVQEFQVCLSNCDLATGMTANGAVNVATRSGGTEWHGSGFYFFRDHYLSAYPALTRDPTNSDPFFQRQQFGIAAGGPIAAKRLFIFATVERNDQRGVVSTELLTPEFAPLSRITPSPSDGDQLSARLDWPVTDRNSVFVRQSHEGGFSFAPSTVIAAGQLAYPSAWTRQPDWADQSLLGWTSQFGTNRVNDLRFSYFFVSSAEQAPTNANCPGCLGIGAPSITVADLVMGTSTTTTVLGRRYELNDAVTWHLSSHNVQFGGDWETMRGGRTDRRDDPVTMNLFSPSEVRTYNSLQPPSGRIPLPASLLSLPDILNLPLKNFSIGIGDPQVPQHGFGNTRIAPLVHLFAEDNWHIRPSLSLQYGVAWNFDAPLNYDLGKPAYLAPLLGNAGLAATHRNWRNLSPSAGFAWSPGQDRRTVIRGGMGIYYDFQTAFGIADEERVSLGPRGVGRGSYVGAGIANPLNNVQGVPMSNT